MHRQCLRELMRKFAGFSGTVRGQIKQRRASGRMVGQSFHTESTWGPSVSQIAHEHGCAEIMFSFFELPEIGIVAGRAFGSTAVQDGAGGFRWDDTPALYYARLLERSVSLDYARWSACVELIAWLRANT